MNKLILYIAIPVCVVLGMSASAQEVKLHRPFIEQGKKWEYNVTGYKGIPYFHDVLIFEGTEVIDGVEYAVMNEYFNGINISEKIGAYGYFREEANGDVYYRGDRIGETEWVKNQFKNPREMPEVLAFSFVNKFCVCGGDIENCSMTESDSYITPSGEDLICYQGQGFKVIEGIGPMSFFCMLDFQYKMGVQSLIHGIRHKLYSVTDSKGEILYYIEDGGRQHQYKLFLEEGRTWKYLSDNCQDGRRWQETVELRIGDWNWDIGCRYDCWLYRNDNSEPEQATPYCYLWDSYGRLGILWNDEYTYPDPDNHTNHGVIKELLCDMTYLKAENYKYARFAGVINSDFAEVDYTGADGKKYLCYQNSEGTRLIEGVGFVFEYRPASLVGPIDDTAEEYTDRWYLYSVVDADGTEIYSDPRYRPGSGVFSVAADDTPTEYYNLQGVRVPNPTTGLYIVRQGEKAAVKFLK